MRTRRGRHAILAPGGACFPATCCPSRCSTNSDGVDLITCFSFFAIKRMSERSLETWWQQTRLAHRVWQESMQQIITHRAPTQGRAIDTSSLPPSMRVLLCHKTISHEAAELKVLYSSTPNLLSNCEDHVSRGVHDMLTLQPSIPFLVHYLHNLPLTLSFVSSPRIELHSL